ncbi:MAG: hypothetical protein HYR77_07505 [Ignavibacteria bacterium]|nr:hypothetical protein [Ignavibacteria bacterium]
MDDHRISSFISFDTPVSPVTGMLRISVWSVAIACLLSVGYAGYEGWHRECIPGFLVVDAMFSFFLWGAHRQWTITMTPMIKRVPRWIARMTKFPFWYIAGGIGYVCGMLVAKELDLLIVYDRPVKLLFFFGGKFAIAVQLTVSLVFYRKNMLKTIDA